MNGTNRPQRQIFIGNVDFETREEELLEHVRALGIEIFRLRLVQDRETGKGRGFGFIDLHHDETRTTQALVELIGGTFLRGRRLVCRPAHEKKKVDRETSHW